MAKKINKEIVKKIDVFIYKNEYQLLELAGVLSGLLIIGIANRMFINNPIYYFLFFFGLGVGALGFVVEYLIKSDKRKTLEREFNYFLADLGREYKKTKSIGAALTNLSESNFYGSINRDIKKLANRVSWGQDFEDALEAMNENIQSKIIEHTLSLLEVLKDTTISYDKILLNLSKDSTIFKSEKITEKYFGNLFLLSIVIYFVFVIMLLYIDLVIGYKFLWFTTPNTITRLFLNNLLLYLALCMSLFTSFVMCVIKQKKPMFFFKYVAVFFLITIVLFQTFIPRPDAQDILIDGINYLSEINEQSLEINRTIGIKSISAGEIIEKTKAEMIHFVKKEEIDCGLDCAKYTIILEEIVFLDFEIIKNGIEYIIYYEIVR
jgi:hypothetical protein